MNGILRFLTCGSVDDGKSTLIGRILFDTKNVYDDQLITLESESKRIGNAGGNLDFSLLMDGLMAEREQGITIDVAYRYFSTSKRKFIVADTPGHIQYTRNMATGASNCDAAVILIDARQGVLPQTKRHTLICALMGINHVLFAVNKMDLVDWNKSAFDVISGDCVKAVDELSKIGLALSDFSCVPVSSVFGDNVHTLSSSSPWYQGRSVVDWLENVEITSDTENKSLRMPVQYVIKPGISKDKWQSNALAVLSPEQQKNFRGYAGQILSGHISVGDKITVLPSGISSTVSSIIKSSAFADRASQGESVSVSLSDDIDISRYDCISSSDARPELSDIFKVRIVWMDEEPLYSGRRYIFKSHFGVIPADIIKINDLIDLSGYQKLAADKLNKNDIGEIEISVSKPVPFDNYSQEKKSGSFILIDRLKNTTSACGMILHSMRRSHNVHWQNIQISRDLRSGQKHQKPAVLWFTGLSGSGKSTIANLLEQKLYSSGKHTMILDGDNIRHGLNKDLGFTEADRIENIRRIGEVSKLMADAGLIVITSFISPFRSDRETARNMLADSNFIEIFVSAPLEVCEKRDPKGLYKKVRSGEIPNFTGINSPYEEPENPEILIKTDTNEPGQSADMIFEWLKQRGIV